MALLEGVYNSTKLRRELKSRIYYTRRVFLSLIWRIKIERRDVPSLDLSFTVSSQLRLGIFRRYCSLIDTLTK